MNGNQTSGHNTPQLELALLTYKTQSAAWRYLKEQGFKIGKSQFSSHVRDKSKGLYTNQDGHFEQSVLLAYAVKHLKTLARAEDEKATAIQALLSEAQARHKQAQAEREQLKLKREQEQFITREEHEAALASRAAFFKNEVETFIFRIAQRAIRLVDGSQAKLPELLEFWERESANWLDSYTRSPQEVLLHD